MIYYPTLSVIYSYLIVMSEIEYRNRSISQLVSELNSLGGAKVVLEPLKLCAIHEYDL